MVTILAKMRLATLMAVKGCEEPAHEQPGPPQLPPGGAKDQFIGAPSEPAWVDFERELWAHTGEPGKHQESQAAISAALARISSAAEREAAACLLKVVVSGPEVAQGYLQKEATNLQPGTPWRKRLETLLKRLVDPKVPDQKVKEGEHVLSAFSRIDPDQDRRVRFPEVYFLRRKNLEITLAAFQRSGTGRSVAQNTPLRVGYKTYLPAETSYMIADINRRLFDLGSPWVFHFDLQYSAPPHSDVTFTLKDITLTRDAKVYVWPRPALFDFDRSKSLKDATCLFAESDAQEFPATAGLTMSCVRPITFIHLGESRKRTEPTWNYRFPDTPLFAFGDPKFRLSDLVRHVDRQIRTHCGDDHAKYVRLYKEITVSHEAHHHAQFAGLSLPVVVTQAFDRNGLEGSSPLAQAFELHSNLAILPTLIDNPEGTDQEGLALIRLFLDAHGWKGGEMAQGCVLPNAKNLTGVILLKDAKIENGRLRFQVTGCREDLHRVEQVIKGYLEGYESRIIWPHIARHLERRSLISASSDAGERVARAKVWMADAIEKEQQVSPLAAENAGPRLWSTILLDMEINGHMQEMLQDGTKEIPGFHQNLAAAVGLPARDRTDFLSQVMTRLLANSR